MHVYQIRCHGAGWTDDEFEEMIAHLRRFWQRLRILSVSLGLPEGGYKDDLPCNSHEISGCCSHGVDKPYQFEITTVAAKATPQPSFTTFPVITGFSSPLARWYSTLIYIPQFFMMSSLIHSPFNKAFTSFTKATPGYRDERTQYPSEKPSLPAAL